MASDIRWLPLQQRDYLIDVGPEAEIEITFNTVNEDLSRSYKTASIVYRAPYIVKELGLVLPTLDEYRKKKGLVDKLRGDLKKSSGKG